MESFLLPSLRLQKCIIHEGSVKSINPAGSALPSGTLLTQWIIGWRAEIFIWPVRIFMWTHWITGFTLHMHVLRRWRSKAVCVFMNQTEMNSIVLMMRYFSRTALIPYACVYPVIVTASARLQKKTSICFLSDIKMNDEKGRFYKKWCRSHFPSAHVETSECRLFPSAALDFFSSDKDLIFWKWSLLICFWLKGLWCRIVSVLLPPLWCSCPLLWLPSQQEAAGGL